MSHYTDCMLLWDWLDSDALPANVQAALERVLDELERYGRGMGRNVAIGDWPWPAQVNPRFRPENKFDADARALAERVSAALPSSENRKLTIPELADRANAAFDQLLAVLVSHPDQIKQACERHRAASDAWHRALMAEREKR
jgi:hypothetical protein